MTQATPLGGSRLEKSFDSVFKSPPVAFPGDAPRTRNFEHYVNLKDTSEEKTKQLNEAVAWCKANDKGAAACLTENPHLDKNAGLGGLLTRNPITQRLKGEVVIGKEYAMCTILTPLEEKELVE